MTDETGRAAAATKTLRMMGSRSNGIVTRYITSGRITKQERSTKTSSRGMRFISETPILKIVMPMKKSASGEVTEPKLFTVAATKCGIGIERTTKAMPTMKERSGGEKSILTLFIKTSFGRAPPVFATPSVWMA